ncbi:UNVERIFIED_ORG: hypothetical protein ABIB63_001848 [Xanthomonas axonopodis]
MVIDDFDLDHIAFHPSDADAPSIVDPDAVLAAPLALQRFQPVGGRDPQIVKMGAAALSMRNLRRATNWMPAGNRRERAPSQIFSASLSIKLLIM